MKDENINEPLIKKIIATEDNLEEGEENEQANLLGKKNAEIILKNRIISKIYFLFFIQLSINFLFIYYSFTNEKFKNLLEKNNELFYLSIGITAIIFFFSFKNRILLITVSFNYFFFFFFFFNFFLFIFFIFYFYIFLFLIFEVLVWGVGDWGWGMGDWGLGPIPNPQSPIPHPQSPTPLYFFSINNI